MTGARFVMLSLSPAEAERLGREGPRRDLIEIASSLGATLVFRDAPPRRRRFTRFAGPHVRQAWKLAGRIQDGDVVIADGEHTGVPLLLFGALRRKRFRLLVVGHLVSKPWKLAALAVATRLGARGILVLHSVEQRRIVGRWLGRRWRTELLPYQVDTTFWSPGETPRTGQMPLILAVGAEHRDYATFFAAVDGLEAEVVVAAGSHWARTAAAATRAPANTRLITEPLPFATLRELYHRANVVAVPLQDVPNQSGITVLLEAMSCGLPVVVTATRGQRECVVGPLITASSGAEGPPLPGRGPAELLGAAAKEAAVNGLYVCPGDTAGLRRAIALLIGDAAMRAELGGNGRESAVANFSIEGFVGRFGRLVAELERCGV